MIELGRLTDRKPPFKYSAIARVWFSDTDAQGVVYYGRYLPYFDHARTEYHRHLGQSRTWSDGRGVRHARLERRVPRAGPLRRPARDLRPHGAHRADERDVRVRRLSDGRRPADGDGDADAWCSSTCTERRPCEIPQAYRDTIRGFEGEDLEA